MNEKYWEEAHKKIDNMPIEELEIMYDRIKSKMSDEELEIIESTNIFNKMPHEEQR